MNNKIINPAKREQPEKKAGKENKREEQKGKQGERTIVYIFTPSPTERKQSSKKHTFLSIILITLIAPFFWQGCPIPTSGSSGPTIIIPAHTETVTATISESTDVYFVFTNISTEGDTTGSPSITDNNPSVASTVQETPSFSSGASLALLSAEETVYEDEQLKEIRKFNEAPVAQPSRIKTAFSTLKKSLSEEPTADASNPPSDSVNDSKTFYYSLDQSVSINATCRLVREVNGQTLSIWVADDCWEGAGIKKREMNDTMVQTAADKFLQTGNDNDIFEWDTSLFGEHYNNTTPYSNLISDNNKTHISILFYDINGDDSANGGVLGIFWAKDFYLSSSYDGSNERTMFYLDAVLFANNTDSGATADDGSGWATSDYWPQKLIGTMAHEFQHMINWTWNLTHRNGTMVNEMCSLMAEDFLASKLGIPGPRYNNSLTSTNPIAANGGRLPYYNNYITDSLLVWGPESDTMRSYGLAYGFGSFLARRYGGAPLFQKIVQNSYGDFDSIVAAVNTQNGTNLSLQDILIEWGKHTVLSQYTNTSAYRSGDIANNSVAGGITYSLGPIDLSEYYPTPKYYTVNTVATPKAASNTYVKVGTFTANKNWTVSLPPNVVLTVVKSTDTF